MKKINSMQIILLAVLTAILIVAQVSLSFIPNVELVTPLIIMFTLISGKRVFYVIYSFVIIEGIIFGFGIWWISYMYIWSILAFAVILFKNNKNIILYAVIAGAFGLIFGALCGFPYLLIGGASSFMAYWISGIPFDIIHCISNFFCTLILFKPIYSVMETIKEKLQ